MSIVKFFACSSEVEPAGLFSVSHIIYIAITLTVVATALSFTTALDHSKIKTIIKIFSIFLCSIEAIKIIFMLCTGHASDPNSYIPLYFCSIAMYASLLSAFAKNKAKRLGDVFLTTGGIIGGLFFIIYPLTSMTLYPAFHFVTFQSYLFHGVMLYIGLLMLISGYCKLHIRDVCYHICIVVAMSAVALAVNMLLGSNLMFVSQNYPGTFIEILYNAFPSPWFTIIMIISQASLPFFLVYAVYKSVTKIRKKAE